MNKRNWLVGVVALAFLIPFLNARFSPTASFEITNPPAPNRDPATGELCSEPQNGVSWTQVPHDIPGFPNYFVGRSPASSEGCKDNGNTKWKLVVGEMNWTTKSMSIVNTGLLDFLPGETVSIFNGTIPINTAYDPSLLFAYGKLWVAFECGALIGGHWLTSVCMGPIDTTGPVSQWSLNLDQTTVIAVANTYGNVNASASVPKLFFWRGLPYMYYTDVQTHSSTGKWKGSSVRGVLLNYDGIHFWADSSIGKPMPAVDPKLNWPVLRTDRFDQNSDQFADAFSVVTVGPPGAETGIYLLGAVGGSNGSINLTQAEGSCLSPDGGFFMSSLGCYRMVIASATQPLGDSIFNRKRVQTTSGLLPLNPSNYVMPIRTNTYNLQTNSFDESYVMALLSCDGGSATYAENWKPTKPCSASDLWRSMAFPLDFNTLKTTETARTFRPGNLTLKSGETRIIGDGKLIYQVDGNLVLYNYFKRSVWATPYSSPGYCSTGECKAEFDLTGNLVLSRDGKVYWSSETAGTGKNLTFRITAGEPHFEITGDDNEPLLNQNPTHKYLSYQLRLVAGRSIATAGEGILAYQQEGNLVLYDSYGKAIWASPLFDNPCEGKICVAAFRDGNLILYRDGQPYWTSNTKGRGKYLVISARQGETPLEILDSNRQQIFK